MQEGVINISQLQGEKVMQEKLTYISLFSSAGVGCYAFKLNGFECVATNELIERRLNIQKCNKKCKYDSGYICGDITKREIQQKIYEEIALWKQRDFINEIDVLIATPPCQGMSVANHKKSDDEIIRNSLVIESIKMIKNICPKFFIFENVPAFMKTICTDIDGNDKPIAEAINYNLGKMYTYHSEVINFKNYGSNSSRTRTIVIGVRKDFISYISPIDLFPSYRKERTLREVIGDLKSLNNPHEFDENDIYHNFRYYDPKMRPWIHDLKEGKSAFDNSNVKNRPHQIKNGILIENVRKNGDKYTRQYWNKVAPCIHTRNDQLASQNTIHPSDDRVFSIRELMLMMSIPYSFKWTMHEFEDLNKLSLNEKIKFMKKEEINIRQCIGEAVPTGVFLSVSDKIKRFLSKKNLTQRDINEIIDDYKLDKNGNVLKFIRDKGKEYNFSTLCKIVELSNSKRNEQSAFYTDIFLINYIFDYLPDFEKDTIRILEPSVGAGNFIPCIIKKYENKKIEFDLVDIDEIAIAVLKELIKYLDCPNVVFNFIHEDFLLKQFDNKYDLVVGNPPFTKLAKNSSLLQKYFESELIENKMSTNLASLFLEKSSHIADHVVMIMPKNLLNTPEFHFTREYFSKLGIESIIDFGEKGFKGVLIETICLHINTKALPSITRVISITQEINVLKKQNYITDSNLPYWIIYRNKDFDLFYNDMIFNIFNVFRDRQISSANLHSKKMNNDIRVIKSRNISDTGENIINITGYDGYINLDDLKELEVYKYLNNENVYLTPNMTYKSRMIKKEKGYVVNGSVAILTLKEKINITDKDLLYFASEQYRQFLQIARNYQTRSLNIDASSVYFFGIRRSN